MTRSLVLCVLSAAVVLGGWIAPAQATWPPEGLRVSDEPGSRQSPVTVADESDGVLVAWIDQRPVAPGIYVTRINGAGERSAGWLAGGNPLCTAASNPTGLVMCEDGFGGAIAVWIDSRAGNRDLYAQRILAGGAIAPGWSAGGFPVCTAPADQVEATVIADGAGGALVTWQDRRMGQDDVYVQRITANSSIASGWPVDGFPICDEPASQLLPRIAVLSSVSAIVVWQDGRGPYGWEVYGSAISMEAAPLPGWPEDGLLIAGGSEADSPNQLAPSVAPDGAGGAFVAWKAKNYRGARSA